jgi:hypothetical protein
VTNKDMSVVICLILSVILNVISGCANQKASLPIKNRLPQNELAYYCDPFEKMREDLWDSAGYLFREEQIQKFKLADMQFENGKLIIRTKTGSFSKGGLSSKYVLRGDFDIQLDCQIDFLKGISSRDMDQVFTFGVVDKSQSMEKMTAALIGLSMKGGDYRGYVFSNGFVNGRKKKGDFQPIGTFKGSFRLLRTNKTITTLYKKVGAVEWTKMSSFRITDNDMIIGSQVANFSTKRSAIRATHSISAEFDSFKINAAQEIIEEEI